ncbi:unnamed protein product (mitochondrion) [Plasmodiophora brassicae]|uniref:Uncharacterized protein n=1 Tax=Plasmodiophora brassicae TaxID=37360 RepID=A0A3P3YPF9_PLABS|nr:unnamed protein product [Plasmodiophora brassicae]
MAAAIADVVAALELPGLRDDVDVDVPIATAAGPALLRGIAASSLRKYHLASAVSLATTARGLTPANFTVI